MVFSGLSFLYMFLSLLLFFYFICKNVTYRNMILLTASLFFYAWGEPKYIVVMLLSVCIAYVGGLVISFCEKKEMHIIKKICFLLTSVLLVGFLLVFKYLNLFVDTWNQMFSKEITIASIVLPIGISFYTFQILSYVIDLYYGKVNVQKNIFVLMLYVSFFPQLIAGPIVRYETVEYELKNRKECFDDIVWGIERFIVGLAKKVLLANRLAKLSEDLFALGTNEIGTLFVWIAVIAYALQIYFDFSGYSDMAIGLGRIFGFHFPENFNYPYCSCSVTEFWRRWHISLSTWFRDYIYIPLGGNRVSAKRHIFNIVITWGLTGFWHGASWNFLLWGLYYAALLLLEKYLFKNLLKTLPKLLLWGYTFLMTIFGWVIFSKESIADILITVKAMFTYTPSSIVTVFAENSSLVTSLMILPIAFIFSFPIMRRFCDSQKLVVILFREAVYLILFICSVICLLSSSYNPFIYFRF